MWFPIHREFTPPLGGYAFLCSSCGFVHGVERPLCCRCDAVKDASSVVLFPGFSDALDVAREGITRRDTGEWALPKEFFSKSRGQQ